jgi:hypothetical protein
VTQLSGLKEDIERELERSLKPKKLRGKKNSPNTKSQVTPDMTPINTNELN